MKIVCAFAFLITVCVCNCLPAGEGDLDRTFGTAGKVITDFAGDDDRVNAVAVQDDGKIVAGGSGTIATSGLWDFALLPAHAVEPLGSFRLRSLHD